ncbi:hypothetical protein DID77_03210 [Candidatus Marinamargulisbacteria bacterium SCGC AG-439-L15]|nr:hypothetical protein DID77_03210 [Candidatus Marinamargulisbacteria bacterium SCGC AG-439-L15]
MYKVLSITTNPQFLFENKGFQRDIIKLKQVIQRLKSQISHTITNVRLDFLKSIDGGLIADPLAQLRALLENALCVDLEEMTVTDPEKKDQPLSKTLEMYKNHYAFLNQLHQDYLNFHSRCLKQFQVVFRNYYEHEVKGTSVLSN